MARISQGSFSLLPDLTDSQIKAQVDYALKNGFAVGIEYTDDPHPRPARYSRFRCRVESYTVLSSKKVNRLKIVISVDF
jgi:ribulose bisphosphate carboxylase small subunit